MWAKSKIENIFNQVLTHEANAIDEFSTAFNHNDVEKVVNCILKSYYSEPSRLFITGVGKSSFVARKFASTLSSIGIPTTYLCPLDAVHGGLGALRDFDMVIAFSKSGESVEILPIVERLQHLFGTFFICITTEPDSSLAKAANALIIYNAQECCGTGFIPTTSCTLAMAIADGLAVSCMQLIDFKLSNFSKFHPGGSLGKQVRECIN